MEKIWVFLIIIMITGLASTISGNGRAMPVIIDVRTNSEYAMGHLEGAINIPYDEIGRKIGSFVQDKSQKIYVYCRTGRRSKIAKESLEKLGYNNVVDLGTLKDAANSLSTKIVQ
jgi:phage shock protein E